MRNGIMSAAAVFGWDVGGAHVKVSRVDAAGVVEDVAQWACPLWQGLEHLHRAIDAACTRWPDACDACSRHAVTMTGEMVDLFADREHGVLALVDALAGRLGADTRFFAGAAGWLDAAHGVEQWRAVASANWLATAQLVAAHRHDGVLIDIGSTTTDIVPIVDARVAARGDSDASRLVTGELAYHGVVRTPLCGIAHRIAFRGETASVMNEWFATSADIYRVTGELWPPHDQQASADNGPKTVAASCARLARTIGRDARDATEDEWRAFAHAWRNAQLRAIAASVEQVWEAHPSLAGAPVVGAGCGRFLAAAVAEAHARDYVDFGTFVQTAANAPRDAAEWIATCAPSVAVAWLMAGRGHPQRAA
ncbi:hydantoinase/oxoprolinase family protein [Paraburkholderia phymatum]|uniref:H4MPT-linked C1 transfer pathway protein n=1 Tax=Paraburkholderia phymatum (strain DSM 17167 / CIP 108236 / LMG 21445 / STM815) TaxID=391038 RepID=B2JX54_PARP8|nr:hydantoinase/oxoprolinase family protein [Paraburkholderia phymatum]ACC75531.1 H4MPT-linked C1 transfer pathway protein [Paraburkholderia phymatum STM815]